MYDLIDKTSPIPLYHQLAGWIEARLADGTFSVGSKLPSETSLARQFQLNRNTVRHALAMLTEKGLVETRRGIGTFVKRTSDLVPIHELGRMTSFVDDFNINNIAFDDCLLTKEVIPAWPEMVQKLRCAPGEDLIKIGRLRIADGTPFVLEIQYYRYKMFSALLALDIKGSMYRILTEQLNADLHHSIQTLRALRPSEEVAQQLGIQRNVPIMALESVSYTSGDEPLEVLQAFYRGDRYVFRVESSGYHGSLPGAPGF